MKTRTKALDKKKLQGFEVLVNNFAPVSMAVKNELATETITTTITSTTQTVITEVRFISATPFAKKYQLQKRDITIMMERKVK